MTGNARHQAEAFTLIELLIVVAIIAILAAIAVPNFLEAQTRSKVSRVRSDMRSLDVAITSYKVDSNKWILDAWDLLAGGYPAMQSYDLRIWRQITTPIAYMTSVPTDPFNGAKTMVDPAGAGKGTFPTEDPRYAYYSQGWMAAVAAISTVRPSDFIGQWIILSPGPDKVHNYSEWTDFKLDKSVIDRIYDPTNGTVSFGDIVRWGP